MSEVTESRDLVIIGAGPAGLCAAINASSEGLITTILDDSTSPGGQAKESSAIENYPGFPEAVTGRELMERFIRQALRFGTDIICPTRATRIRRDGTWLVLETEDYTSIASRTVMISTGLSYRRHPAARLGSFMGRGIYYGMPSERLPDKEWTIGIIGGANSAGQAAMKFAQNSKAKVVMYIRKTIEEQMSKYLIDRIKALKNIELCENCDILSVNGTLKLDELEVKGADGKVTLRPTDMLFIFIGASPRTQWLESSLQLDEKKFIRTYLDVNTVGQNHPPLPFETSMKGVFAVGDVRLGSIKRIVAAAGEGGAALSSIHTCLTEVI